MSHDINRSAQCYVAVWENQPVAFLGLLHFPHPRSKLWKNVSRLVVLPDYQGIGIGVALLETVGKIYKKQGYRYKIVTSNPALCKYFERSNDWKCMRQGRVSISIDKSTTPGMQKTFSVKRITTSWEYRI